MAKLSSINRNKKRIRMSKNQKKKRDELRAKAVDPKASDEEKALARWKLQDMPRNGSATRVKTRCQITGRSRGVYRKYELCRNKFRELAHAGLIPGVTKASW